MNKTEVRKYLLAKRGAVEENPEEDHGDKVQGQVPHACLRIGQPPCIVDKTDTHSHDYGREKALPRGQDERFQFPPAYFSL